MNQDQILVLIVKELQEMHGCHTVILYGSRARGDATDASDYDVLGVRESGDMFRDAKLWNGVYLDTFVYPEKDLLEPNHGMLDMRLGKILIQQNDFATQFFARLEMIYQAGPKKLRADEIQAIRTWHEKALARIRIGGIQGNLRRAELVPALLEHFFTTRGEWYRGPKASFQCLKENDAELYQAFETALEPNASLAVLEKLVSLIDARISRESKSAASVPQGSTKKISLDPIGHVKSSRKKPEDDHWDSVQTSIELNATRFNSFSLEGLSAFSHVEIVFYMDQVSPEKIVVDARHPRGNLDWPKVGIFAQRGKNRPNQIGTTICQITKIEGTTLHVIGLDAIDGTPVLDIKPWLTEFGPRSEVRQPAWTSELMKEYWK